MPYDFGESRDGYVLRSLMVEFADQHGSVILPPLVEFTRDAVAKVASSKVKLPIKDITQPENQDFDVEEINQLLQTFSKVQSYITLLQAIYNQQSNIQPRPNVGYTMWLNSQENIELFDSITNVIIRHVI